MAAQIIDNILGMIRGRRPVGAGDTPESHQPPAPWVIHVEDDVEFSAVLKTRLEALGVVVVRAFDGADGMECVQKYPPDAIILDLEMPNGSGEDVLRSLKNNKATQAIPVVVITGSRDPEARMRVRGLGADAFFTKPLDFELLHKHLSKRIDLLPMAPWV